MCSFVFRALPGLILFCAVTTGFAAGPSIGLVTASGSFELDHSKVWENATLFDGSSIETNASSSQVNLARGVKIRLAADSCARVYRSHLVLQRGIGQLESSDYRIEADGLQIAPAQPSGAARVQVAGPNRVIVAARAGAVEVSNRGGVLIARLASGHEMTFEPQAGATAASTRASGILAIKGGKFILVDQVTNVTLQLQGAGLESEVGNLVEITGTSDTAEPTVAGASQLINVTKVTRLLKSVGTKAAAPGRAGAAAAGTAASGGLSTGATVAIIGGVSAAGTIGGLAAAEALPGQGKNKASTSR